MSIFKPKQKLNRFDEFDIKYYKDRGFKAVFLDIDNTITAPDVGCLTLEAKQFIKNIKSNGLDVLILSNNNKKRVKSFVNNNDIKWIYHAYKPLPFAYWKACIMCKSKPGESIMIGDQLLTDILGANLSGCFGIYTKQLQEKDIPITARNRKIEKFIWRHILHEEV